MASINPLYDQSWRAFFLYTNPTRRSINMYEIFAGVRNSRYGDNHWGVFDWIGLGIPILVDTAWQDIKDLTGGYDPSRDRDNPWYVRLGFGLLGIPVGIAKFGCELGRGVLGFVGTTILAIPMELVHVVGAPIYNAWDRRRPPSHLAVYTDEAEETEEQKHGDKKVNDNNPAFTAVGVIVGQPVDPLQAGVSADHAVHENPVLRQPDTKDSQQPVEGRDNTFEN